ncbi:hypothetical protein TeGR_g11604 [Tetraparma gracilis]|uniref:Dihydroxyacetone kinase n=1 Tax=Tetraparma gracilis TaxID=2962635 RepID=A0ABQ6M3W0_9STRA|nr:hypothetical protein TeGR_g11604 [Tetraparma gracilis]
MSGKHFVNAPTSAVSDALSGLLLATPSLRALSSSPHVVVRSTPTPGDVALLSGGGSGHEPAHAGFVGAGMLHSAVCGGMFASPSVLEVSRSIAAIAAPGGPGCLMVVKNYTGDRLNFTLAMNKACGRGVDVRMTVVADDCAVPREQGITGRRGVAGAVFVHKCAGAASAGGGALDEVERVAGLVGGRVMSMGCSLGSVALPGAGGGERLGKDQMEVGMGIHGEQGASREKIRPCKEIVKEICGQIVDYGYGEGGRTKIKKGDKLALLVNNLGATSVFEMYIIARDAIEYFKGLGCKVDRCYVGSFMTSFGMHGASVSALVLDEAGEIAELLDAPTECKAWQMAESLSATPPPGPLPMPDTTPDNKAPFKESVAIPDFAAAATAAVTAIAAGLSAAEAELTENDKVVGDGDCGITMKRGADALLAAVPGYSLSAPSQLFLEMADTVSAAMGGTSGALFEIFCRSAALHLRAAQAGGAAPVTGAALAGALCAGADAVRAAGGARVGYRTMVDALEPAAAAARAGGSPGDAARAAREGAESTREMRALAGRSNYVPFERVKGIPDPGAVAVAIIIEAIAGSCA